MNRKATALVIVVFVLGFALGGLTMHLAGERVLGSQHERARGGPARLVEQLTQELGLTPEQQKQLAAILEETKTRYQATYEQVRPQMEQIRQEGRGKIREILTPEQRPKFEEFVRRLDEERKKRNTR